MIINLLTKEGEGEDISCLAGLSQRSPFLAFSMTLAAVSLAGIPPLAGFFGKFLLVKSVAAEAFGNTGYFALLAVAVFGVVISIYYYFGIVRAIFWEEKRKSSQPHCRWHFRCGSCYVAAWRRCFTLAYCRTNR